MNNFSCKENITKIIPKNNSFLKESLFENSSKNYNQRLYLQRNMEQVKNVQMKQYEETLSCCDCYQYPSNFVTFNHDYTCKLRNIFKR